MNIKSLLLGSAAALVAVTGARAADAVVVAEPEAVEYVRVCDTYGKGFFYIPGTETCLKIGGYLRYDAKAGDDPYDGGERGTWWKRSRATLRFDARSETELGTLRSFAETRFQYTNGVQEAVLPAAFIELGGFRIGLSDSQFSSWTDYTIGIISDDVISYGAFENNQVSYTYTGTNGFSATIGLEQGVSGFVIDDYMPHVVAGVKFEQGWGKISLVGGYDSVVEEFAGKLRLDAKFSDTVSAFIMGGYNSDGDKRNAFAQWYGDYAVWGGVTAKVSDKATVNAQAAYEEGGTFAGALNVAYELVPGFTITPEVNYTSFDDSRYSGGDAFQGILRFQRNF
ncbi:porin [Phyllobacterium sp. 628]|uniref:porin n=1 Tax=Phyllobacterium sp. 628 TaxID=2718938 RepID=UPI0016623DFD|nr:porin [Phyllobacterium sp. 628]QND50729.1 porin [Phyllobacterium sp. 628]